MPESKEPKHSKGSKGNDGDKEKKTTSGTMSKVLDMVKSDSRSVANSALYNFAVLYPFYHYDLDRYVFNDRDADWLTAGKTAGLIAGVSEGTKSLRKALTLSGFSDGIVYPFGAN